MKSHNPLKAFFFTFIFSWSASVSSTEPGEVALGDQVQVLLKALSHYESSDTTAKKVFAIVIVHDQAVPGHTVAEIKAAFEGNDQIKVKGMKFEVFTHPFSSKKDLRKKINEVKASAVFLTEGCEKCIREITGVTRKTRILSMSNVSDYVHWLGVTLGVEVEEGQLKLMVNLAGCQHEKIDFDEEVLGNASVYF